MQGQQGQEEAGAAGGDGDARALVCVGVIGNAT